MTIESMPRHGRVCGIARGCGAGDASAECVASAAIECKIWFAVLVLTAQITGRSRRPGADLGRRSGDGTGPGIFITIAVRLVDRLAHSDACLHRRYGLLHRIAGGLALLHRQGHLFPHLDVLDQGVLGRLRRRCGFRHHDAVSVRHQLEPLFRCDLECPCAAVRL